MRYIITLLISMSIFGQVLNKLEKSYLTKADLLQSDHDNKVKALDDRLVTESRRLAEVYLKALKALLKSETQKGDFDSAIKVKAKITEMENMLKSEAVAVANGSITVTKPIGVHHDLIGVWQTTNTKGTKYIYTFYKNGTSFHENNSNKNTITGKWEAVENEIHIVFSNKHSFTLKRLGNIYIGPHYKFKKEATDPIVGSWTPDIIGNAKPKTAIFDLKDAITGTGRYTITFKFTKGKYALVIDSVELLRTGIPIAKDIHKGWAGSLSSSNTYILDIKYYRKGPYKLRIKLYGDLGVDSFGDIYIEKIQ